MDTRTSQVMATALPTAVPLAKRILDAVKRSQEAVAEAESRGEDSLATEAARQRIMMESQAHTARVAQELAVAERMASADEVQIEEYYEGTGKGTAGLNVDGGVVVAGLSGEGRRVTKRVIKLQGSTLAVGDHGTT